MQLRQTSEYLTQENIISLKVSSDVESNFQSPQTRIVLVIDISGSMNTQVVSKSQDGDVETGGFNQLDLVKHSSYTILENLRPEDSIAVVAFTTNARIEVPLTLATPENKKKIKDKITSLRPEASTNLWDGLYKGMELLKNNPSQCTNDAIFLLTDGMPNVFPPRGHIPTLKDYLDQNPLNFTISTFGFGYSLDSLLLKEIAVLGNGHYGFIPDGNFVGTIFVNAMANLLTVVARNLTLSLTFADDDQPDLLDFPYPYTRTSWGYQVQLGSYRYGQERLIVIPFQKGSKEEHYIQANLHYHTFDSPDEKEDIHFGVNDIETSQEGVFHNFRQKMVDLLGRLATNSNLQEDQHGIQRLLREMTHSRFKEDSLLQGLITDLSGQVTEACSRSDWYDRWGKHYMRSLHDAHLYQHCNNFKDQGVSNYGGLNFKLFKNN